MLKIVIIAVIVPLVIYAKPTVVEKSISASASIEGDGGAPPPVTFGKGGVGVNFLGFKASAGLGGLLTGDAADGGLHAEAGTPFGQAAGAGLAGNAEGSGKSAGGLYAGASAGGGVDAGAGLQGASSYSGSFSKSYAGASAGHVSTHVTKVAQKPAFGGGGVSGKFVAAVHSAPAVYHKEVEVVHEQPEQKPQTTYVERTVIPNYVEKTIQVPSYVEKTVRVPTVVEKKIRVPAPPTVIEKEVEGPAHGASAGVDLSARGNYGGNAGGVVKVVEKTKFRPAHRQGSLFIRKHWGGGYGGDAYNSGGYGGGYGGGFGFGGFGGGYGGGYGAGSAGYGGQSAGHYTASVRKTVNPQFFNDIFNIPISTLGAVSKLVSGIAGGASGSLSVSKQVGVGASSY